MQSVERKRVLVLTCRQFHLSGLSVWLTVGRSVRRVHCGNTAHWISMTFGLVSVVGQGMGVLDGGGDRQRGRSSFGSKHGTFHCN